jgi:hypothetical protein
MKVEDCHNDTSARQLRQVGEKCGAIVTAAQPLPVKGNDNNLELPMEKEGRRIVCSAETSWRRCSVGQGVRKAAALGAQLLLIATPDSLTAQACRRQLRRLLPQAAKLRVIACPLGSAVEILRQTLNAIPNQPGPVAPDQRKEP